MMPYPVVLFPLLFIELRRMLQFFINESNLGNYSRSQLLQKLKLTHLFIIFYNCITLMTRLLLMKLA
jgi:hypothetical protein